MAGISLRNLSPSAAWHEAERRSIPLGIVGFFAAGLVFTFAGLSRLHNDLLFLTTIAGAMGSFLAALAMFLAYYHKRWLHGIVTAVFAVLTIFTVNFFWTRVIIPPAGALGAVAPTAVTGLLFYIGLNWLHGRLCGITSRNIQGLATDDDYGLPQKGWEQIVYWICALIGGILVLVLIAAHH